MGLQSKMGKASPALYAAVAVLSLSIVLLIVGIALDAKCGREKAAATTGTGLRNISGLKEFCKYSPEADRIGLDSFLKKVQKAFYDNMPNNVVYDPDVKSSDRFEDLKKRYFPYDPRPQALKNKTDAALRLLEELNKFKYTPRKLKPRENRVIYQVKHYLKTVFGTPYDTNFYAGDWLLGPNYFCWQPICNLQYDVNALGYYAKPKTKEDIEHLIKKLTDHGTTVDNYIANMKTGVKAGMVRAKIDCQAGLDAFKDRHKILTSERRGSAVLKEWFSKNFKSSNLYAMINKTVSDAWSAEKGKTVQQSVQDALVTGVGDPIVKLINYLELTHSKHCLTNDLSSGLGNLPVSNVYTNGVPGEATTKKMPLTGETLSGKEGYKKILYYFTTFDISPEDIKTEGENQLKTFYNQSIEIAKKIMKDAKTTEEAITKFKLYLNSDEMWHGTAKFPDNESNAEAYKKCKTHATAKLYCPVRWKSIMIWAEYFQKVMSMIHPKLVPLFTFSGDKNTVPNCPIEMEPHYNPSNGAHYFQRSDGACTKTTRYGMPFFLEKYGPKYQEWSLTGHEARPGHHTEYQGTEEHFRDKCGGLLSWFDRNGYYIAFTEGWALYAENPLLSDDVNLYKDDMLQKYGMYKWQTWRAVRLIVDTGLHYRGRNMTWARKMFEDYTWDTGDFARKEIVRYMSDPGQALAYMLGRLEILKMRRRAERELGAKFDLKDFHYQLLSQGASPIAYLKSHMDRYIECTKDNKGELCEYILTPVRSLKDDIGKTAPKEAGPKRPSLLRFT